MLSAKGKIYSPPQKADEAYVTAAIQKFGISDILARLLANKNIPLNEIESFLDPKIKNLLPEPYDFMDMEKGVEFIVNAVKNNKKIFIYGDYDVDGCCASSILKLYFAELGIDAGVYIPNRFKEGYGINLEAIDNLHKQGAELVITVDCGITAFEPLEKAKELGVDVIVLDHHIGVESHPEAIAIINPNRIDESSKYGHLCASGLAFILIVALNRRFEREGWFNQEAHDKIPLPFQGERLGEGINFYISSQEVSKIFEGVSFSVAPLFFSPRLRGEVVGGAREDARLGYIERGKIGSNASSTRKEVPLAFAKELRENQTRQEAKLWSALKTKKLEGLKFRRQQPIGKYIVDFVCAEIKLIVELDGSQHAENIKYDNERTKFLNELGYSVIRFWNNDVDNNLEGVGDTILNIVKLLAPNSNSSPAKQGEEYRCKPNIMRYLDLAALGTVCDVMLLKDVNRAIVSSGLKILQKRNNTGLKNLMDIAGVKEKPDAYSLGFMLGPRINAAGRLDDASYGLKLLTTNDDIEAKQLAEKLNQLNKERQEIEKQNLAEAVEMVEAGIRSQEIGNSKQGENYSALVLYKKNWHQGVIGIMAGRLKEQFNKPALVISVDENNIGKGSARSVSGVDIGAAVTEAKANGLLINGGGHAAAAGFTIDMNKIDEFKDFINNKISADYQKYLENKTERLDLVLNVNSVNLELADEIEKLEPFGNGNPTPVVMIENVKIGKVNIYAEKHVAMFVSDGRSIRAGAGSLKCVAFNAVGTALEQVINENVMKNVSLIGKVKKNFWNGNYNVDFIVEDILSY